MESARHKLVHPGYRPEIDGLRAIAVLSVVGYHVAPAALRGGFVGVDIFFVISGFLISTIIFGNLERDRFSYAEFYARRIKRIFPALLLVLSLSLAFGWYVLLPDEFRQFGKHLMAGAGFVSNFALWSEAGYFDRAAEVKPLLHLWSLGIEEQFYILWPLLLGIVWYRKSSFLMTTLLVAIISFIINIYWAYRDPAADFFSPFTRIWELMVGGILAYIVLYRPHYLSSNAKLLSLLSLLGLLLIVFSVGFLPEIASFPGWWALPATLGAFLLIAGGPGVWVNRYLLSNRLMVWVGLISYPLYLWHWPLLSFARIIEGDTPATSIKLAAAMASIVLAWGTYTLIEKPFRRGYSKTAISILSLSMTFLFVIGLLVWKGWPPPRHDSKSIEPLITAVGDWGFPDGLETISWHRQTFFVKEGSNTKTLFFGDSHVQQYAPRIVRLLTENPNHNTAVFATAGGCPPIPNVSANKLVWCPSMTASAIEYIDRDDVETVVIGAHWNNYFLNAARKRIGQEANQYLYYFEGDNSERHSFSGGNGAALALQELEIFLGRVAQNKQVFLVLDNPSGENYSPESLFEGSRLTNIRESVGDNQITSYAPEQRQLRIQLKAIAARSGAIVIDPSLLLCTEQRCMVTTENGVPIYKDESHLRPFFVEQQADFIDVTVQ